ncbi:Bgt-128 [Blumeria graminis f. sp. tritici]|uniref:Bgt-128 n=3 Tax=Blumeria graminis TaxID=34373 RepID=A0A061HJ40_BLUGR|nr:Cytoplasmic glutaredoxin thioltransferase glutathione-dependent disulfide oxidoreductase [Blumeria graminis f. sp. tritici 96224]VCU39815.1 Bgt-128 [Blumeria graminis f. sp. tritici]
MSTAKAKVEQIINDHAVAVFSKSYCPHCDHTKNLLESMGAKYTAIELDQIDDGSTIQAALKEINGQSTVPNIYINKVHIGGNSDLQSKKSTLPSLLKDAGAL